MNFDLNITAVKSIKFNRIEEFPRYFIGGGGRNYSFDELTISVTSIFKIILKNIRLVDRVS